MNTGYIAFYKDKDGYETILTEFGQFVVYPNEHQAQMALVKIQAQITDTLNPRHEYKTSGFLRKTVVKIEPTQVPDHQRALYTQILNTAYVRRVQIV